MRRVSRAVSSKRAWDVPLAELGVPLTLAEEKLLQQHVRVAIHNAPCSTDVHLATTTVYAAADACNDHVRKDGVKVSGGGWVLYGAAYVVGSHDYLADRCAWGGEWLDQAIHILEAQAVLELLKWMPPAPALTRLLLGEDNTIVVAALNNGYSSCVKTRHIVKEILAEAKKKRYLTLSPFGSRRRKMQQTLFPETKKWTSTARSTPGEFCMGRPHRQRKPESGSGSLQRVWIIRLRILMLKS